MAFALVHKVVFFFLLVGADGFGERYPAMVEESPLAKHLGGVVVGRAEAGVHPHRLLEQVGVAFPHFQPAGRTAEGASHAGAPGQGASRIVVLEPSLAFPAGHRQVVYQREAVLDPPFAVGFGPHHFIGGYAQPHFHVGVRRQHLPGPDAEQFPHLYSDGVQLVVFGALPPVDARRIAVALGEEGGNGQPGLPLGVHPVADIIPQAPPVADGVDREADLRAEPFHRVVYSLRFPSRIGEEGYIRFDPERSPLGQQAHHRALNPPAQADNP